MSQTHTERSGVERVLVVGVYLADRDNNAATLVQELNRSKCRQVEQRWVALGRGAIPEALASVTVSRVTPPRPKFALLNAILANVELAVEDFVIVCDDDIGVPDGFLDRYLDTVTRYDLALAQPARTHDSYIDHWFVEQLDGLEARRTRFVEIGPLFSIRGDAFRHIVPFSEESPMGWGYDFVWPVVMDAAGLRMGIVDATPVAHNLRKPVALYDHSRVSQAMEAFLAKRPHLTRHEAFWLVEAYS